jgi:FkbH-like protein
LSGWRINWQDKAKNIAELGEELNLGLDSFVVVDDNPAECDLIRNLLPDVTVLSVPEKLHELPPLLLKQGLFDTLALTDEDKRRVQLYRSESQRKSGRAAYSSVEDYLASLETVAVIHRMLPREIGRVAQLTQKTNQFNLTTRRYSEADVRSFAERADAAVFTLAVRDRFGDLGLVGVAIFEREGKTGKVDTLLMSCRALGRGLDQALLAYCLKSAASIWDVDCWLAEYIPTKKNMQVADFWPKNGFVRSDDKERMSYRRNAREGSGAILTHIRIEEA